MLNPPRAKWKGFRLLSQIGCVDFTDYGFKNLSFPSVSALQNCLHLSVGSGWCTEKHLHHFLLTSLYFTDSPPLRCTVATDSPNSAPTPHPPPRPVPPVRLLTADVAAKWTGEANYPFHQLHVPVDAPLKRRQVRFVHIGDNKSSEGWLNHRDVIYIHMHTLEACDQGKHDSSDAAFVTQRGRQEWCK